MKKQPESERILAVTNEFRSLTAIAHANMDYDQFCERTGLLGMGNYTKSRWEKFQKLMLLLTGFSPVILARLLLPDTKMLGEIPLFESDETQVLIDAGLQELSALLEAGEIEENPHQHSRYE